MVLSVCDFIGFEKRYTISKIITVQYVGYSLIDHRFVSVMFIVCNVHTDTNTIHTD